MKRAARRLVGVLAAFVLYWGFTFALVVVSPESDRPLGAILRQSAGIVVLSTVILAGVGGLIALAAWGFGGKK